MSRFVARRVTDPHTVDDLTTEIFLAAIDTGGTYKAERGSEVAWLFGIARNVVASELRRAASELYKSGRAAGRRTLVPAIVNFVPAGQKCKGPRAEPVTDIPRGLYYAPRNIPGDDGSSGWQMQINTKLFKPGQTFVWTLAVDPVYGGSDTSTILMRDPVAPCELVPDDEQHVVPKMPVPEDTSLGGYRVEGKTVGEVRPEIEKRGLKVTYLITEPPPERYPGDPYLMYPTKQSTPVGEDWFVWQADEPEKGVIRLMVTQKLQQP
ncbi:hypothetical protein LDL49_04590 [Nonomuraea sp. NEAU-L178]|nr:hypothetical protein [Nonomuraea aurantiaca]